MENSARLVFRGELQPGFEQADVIEPLACLLKISPERVHALFKAKRVVLKQNLSAAQIQPYRNALQKIGLLVHVEEAQSSQERSLETTANKAVATESSDAAFGESYTRETAAASEANPYLAEPMHTNSDAPQANEFYNTNVTSFEQSGGATDDLAAMVVEQPAENRVVQSEAGSAIETISPEETGSHTQQDTLSPFNAGVLTSETNANSNAIANASLLAPSENEQEEYLKTVRIQMAHTFTDAPSEEQSVSRLSFDGLNEKDEDSADTAEIARTQINPKTTATATPKFFSFSFDGRLGRLRYLNYSLGATLLMLPCLALFAVSKTLGLLALAALGIASFVYYLRVTALRLHDIGQTGWLALIAFIPFINTLFMLALLFWPGQKDANSYGPPAGPNHRFAAVPALIYAVLVVLGFALAANQMSGLDESGEADIIAYNDAPAIVMYCTGSSPYCAEARNWFKQQSVQYSECNIDTNARCQEELESLKAGGVPTFVIGREVQTGFDPDRMQKQLEKYQVLSKTS